MAQTPKRASGSKRAIKPGVQGAQPPALFPPAFSGESRAPARSRAGNHLAGSNLRWSRKDHQSPQLGGLDKEGPPPRLFASGLSLEKAWIPRPGPGGNPPRRCEPAPVQTRTTYQGQPGAAYPLGGCLRSRLGAQRPVARPAPGGGARLSLEESRRKEHQGSALDPGFYGRSLPLAGFGDGCLWPVRGSISSGILRPIWDAFSRKICWKAFL